MSRDEFRRRLPNGVWACSAAAVVLLLAVSSRYGFHRDELYFMVAGRRLDWGYVDQPPLTPLVARFSETMFGTSPTALRILPALAVGVIGLLAAIMARRFGGGRKAQVFAAFTTSFTGVLLGVGHLLSTAAFDYLFWTIVLWLLVLILDDADPRLWLGVGVVIGVGLENKYTIGFLATAILIGILVTRRRRTLASPWPWLGAALAALIALPNLIWQARQGWPQLEVAEALAARSDGPVAFLLNQPLLLSVTLTVPAAVGFWWVLRSDQARKWRPIPIAFLVLVLIFMTSGGKAYYVAPMYPVFLAAGAIWFERLNRGQAWVFGSAVVGILVGTVIALPLAPVDVVDSVDATGELGETVGWPDLIDDIEVAYNSIPAEMRDTVVVFTGSYGEAGAVDVLGPAAGLPQASSGHNNYWLWGAPSQHGPIIGVGDVEAALEPICPEINQVATLGNPHGVGNEVMGQPLLICPEPTGQLADIWPLIGHFN